MESKRKVITALICMLLLMAFTPIQSMAASKASIKLSSKTLTVTVGKKGTLTAKVTGKSKSVTWTSSNKKIATVSKGVVTAKAAGTVTITAKANGKTAKCTVTVKQPNYRALYKKFLAKSTVKGGKDTYKPGLFYILNIDRKGVPELIVAKQGSLPTVTLYVYTVINGKVTYIGTCTSKSGSFYPTVQYSKKYKGIYSGGWINGIGGAWGALYTMDSSGKKLSSKYYAREEHNPKDVYYTGTSSSKCKKVSKSTCSSFSKKYFSNLTSYKLLDNTAENRGKI